MEQKMMGWSVQSIFVPTELSTVDDFFSAGANYSLYFLQTPLMVYKPSGP